MATGYEQGPTDVTGSPVTRGKGAHPGEVLGERYEVVERIGRDAFVTDHRALDQETERTCILRLLEPALLSGLEPREIVDKLKGVVGIGNQFLPGLLDTDIDEKGRLYVVEPLPIGARLREVLSSRRARGDALDPKEVLPVVARLAAAIAAIPLPFHHGDVRIDRIWLAEGGLSLTFPFVVAMLPPGGVAGTTQGDPVLSRTLAPELSRGIVGNAADRFGVACVAFECLTGLLPKPGEASPGDLGKVGEILTALLSTSPTDRPTSLTPLVEAIAEMAGLPVPALDAGQYRKAIRASGNPTSGLLLPPDEVVEPTPMGAPTRNRRALSTDTIEETATDLADSTAKVPPMSIEAAKEALAHDFDDLPTETSSRGGLPEGAASGGTQEILAEDLEEVPGDGASPNRTRLSKAKRRGEGTQRVRAEDILEVRNDDGDDGELSTPEPAKEGTQQVRAEDIIEARSAGRAAGGDDRVAPHLLAVVLADDDEKATSAPQTERKPKPSAKRTPSDSGIDPRLMRVALGVELQSEPEKAPPSRQAPAKKRLPPAPKVKATVPIMPPAGRLPRAPGRSAPTAPKPISALPPAPSVPAPVPLPRAEPRHDPAPNVVITGEYDADEDSSIGATSVAPYAAPLAARKTAMGKWILIGAVILAAVIILGGVLIASQRRAEADRERRLQQRFLELQQETGTDQTN